MCCVVYEQKCVLILLVQCKWTIWLCWLHTGPPVLDHTYHFFSGMGRGTAFTRQGKFGCPDKFLPRIVPTRFSGRMTKKQIQQTATCGTDKRIWLMFSWEVCVYSQHPTPRVFSDPPSSISAVPSLCRRNVLSSAWCLLINCGNCREVLDPLWAGLLLWCSWSWARYTHWKQCTPN